MSRFHDSLGEEKQKDPSLLQEKGFQYSFFLVAIMLPAFILAIDRRLVSPSIV